MPQLRFVLPRFSESSDSIVVQSRRIKKNPPNLLTTAHAPLKSLFQDVYTFEHWLYVQLEEVNPPSHPSQFALTDRPIRIAGWGDGTTGAAPEGVASDTLQVTWQHYQQPYVNITADDIKQVVSDFIRNHKPSGDADLDERHLNKEDVFGFTSVPGTGQKTVCTMTIKCKNAAHRTKLFNFLTNVENLYHECFWSPLDESAETQSHFETAFVQRRLYPVNPEQWVGNATKPVFFASGASSEYHDNDGTRWDSAGNAKPPSCDKELTANNLKEAIRLGKRTVGNFTFSKIRRSAWNALSINNMTRRCCINVDGEWFQPNLNSATAAPLDGAWDARWFNGANKIAKEHEPAIRVLQHTLRMMERHFNNVLVQNDGYCFVFVRPIHRQQTTNFNPTKKRFYESGGLNHTLSVHRDGIPNSNSITYDFFLVEAAFGGPEQKPLVIPKDVETIVLEANTSDIRLEHIAVIRGVYFYQWVVAHESFHAFQYASQNRQRVRKHDSVRKQVVPQWLQEGAACLYGMLLVECINNHARGSDVAGDSLNYLYNDPYSEVDYNTNARTKMLQYVRKLKTRRHDKLRWRLIAVDSKRVPNALSRLQADEWTWYKKLSALREWLQTWQYHSPVHWGKTIEQTLIDRTFSNSDPNERLFLHGHIVFYRNQKTDGNAGKWRRACVEDLSMFSQVKIAITSQTTVQNVKDTLKALTGVAATDQALLADAGAFGNSHKVYDINVPIALTTNTQFEPPHSVIVRLPATVREQLGTARVFAYGDTTPPNDLILAVAGIMGVQAADITVSYSRGGETNNVVFNPIPTQTLYELFGLDVIHVDVNGYESTAPDISKVLVVNLNTAQSWKPPSPSVSAAKLTKLYDYWSGIRHFTTSEIGVDPANLPNRCCISAGVFFVQDTVGDHEYFGRIPGELYFNRDYVAQQIESCELTRMQIYMTLQLANMSSLRRVLVDAFSQNGYYDDTEDLIFEPSEPYSSESIPKIGLRAREEAATRVFSFTEANFLHHIDFRLENNIMEPVVNTMPADPYTLDAVFNTNTEPRVGLRYATMGNTITDCSLLATAVNPVSFTPLTGKRFCTWAGTFNDSTFNIVSRSSLKVLDESTSECPPNALLGNTYRFFRITPHDSKMYDRMGAFTVLSDDQLKLIREKYRSVPSSDGSMISAETLKLTDKKMTVSQTDATRAGIKSLHKFNKFEGVHGIFIPEVFRDADPSRWRISKLVSQEHKALCKAVPLATIQPLWKDRSRSFPMHVIKDVKKALDDTIPPHVKLTTRYYIPIDIQWPDGIELREQLCLIPVALDEPKSAPEKKRENLTDVAKVFAVIGGIVGVFFIGFLIKWQRRKRSLAKRAELVPPAGRDESPFTVENQALSAASTAEPTSTVAKLQTPVASKRQRSFIEDDRGTPLKSRPPRDGNTLATSPRRQRSLPAVRQYQQKFNEAQALLV